MYQRHDLLSTLEKEEDFCATLTACTLLDKQEYTEEEADRFRECRSLIEQGKSYKQVAAHFRRIDKNLKPQNGQDEVDTMEAMLEISELLALASEQVEARISLTEAVQILNACDLPDREQYSSLECDRFLEACALKQQGKTYKEIATYFGIQQMETNDSHTIGAALDIDTAAAKLVNDLAHSKAAEAASLVVPAFKYHFAREISSSKIRQEFEAFGHQLHAELGKGETRMMRVMMEINSAPSLHQKQAALPEASNNGLTSE